MNPVVIRAHLTSWSGYGLVAQNLGRAIEARGVPVSYVPISRDERYGPLNPFVRDRIRPGARPTLTLAGPTSDFGAELGDDAVFTMWETTRLPSGAAEWLNTHPVVIVPCRANADWFHKCGVTSPVVVAPLGVERVEPKPPPAGPTVFGTAGRMAHGGARKGLSEVMAAFVKAFPAGEDARLEVKCWPDCIPRLAIPDDPRITILTDSWTRGELSAWYDRLTCFVTASKGEGFGLHALEAMAHGRFVVATRWSGTADFFSWRFGWELEYYLGPAEGLYTGCGDWAIPREESLVKAMRGCHANRPDVRAKGFLAATRAREFTWDRTAEAVLSALGMARTINAGRWPDGIPQPAVSRHDIMEQASTCRHRSRRNWHAVCRAGVGGIAPHHVVTADDCVGCLGRGEAPAWA